MGSVTPAAASGGWVGSEPCPGGRTQGLLQESSWSPGWEAGGLRLRTQTHQSPPQLSVLTSPSFLCLRHQPSSHMLSPSWPKSQAAVAALDGLLCPKGGTTQGRSGQALKKENSGTCLSQFRLLSQPCPGQARRCSGKAETGLAQKGGRVVLAKGTVAEA